MAAIKPNTNGSGDVMLNGSLLLHANIVTAKHTPTVRELASITVIGSAAALR